MKTFHTALLFILLAFATPGKAQQFSTISTRWSDSFVEWDLYALTGDTTDEGFPDEAIAGELRLRWLGVKDDFSEWEYRVGDESGNIRAKFKDDPTYWELRSFSGSIISMRTAWSNDFTEWRVTDNATTLILRSRWKNQLDEWLVDDRNYGKYHIYTLRQQDPRDWGIDDNLDPGVSQPMKIAFIFLTVFHSSPRM
ncbi:MAG: hypothetical protein IT270_02775 [Saprospiraceae bacterium]|nr:hypothetical protein [Saprospiraceae bacterium]